MVGIRRVWRERRREDLVDEGLGPGFISPAGQDSLRPGCRKFPAPEAPPSRVDGVVNAAAEIEENRGWVGSEKKMGRGFVRSRIFGLEDGCQFWRDAGESWRSAFAASPRKRAEDFSKMAWARRSSAVRLASIT